MTTRRTFLKTSGLATLAGALGCATDGDAASASPDGASGDAALAGDSDGPDSGTPSDDTAGEPETSPRADAAPDDASPPEDVPPEPEVEDYVYEGTPGPEDLFQHGVASGDPHSTSVVLWTRVTQAGSDPVPVFWDMATDPAFEHRVAAGWAEATAERDFTVKLIAGGLQAGTTYYYRLRALGRTAPLGRTRTLPTGPTAQVRLAFGSCAEIQSAWYHAYRHVAARSDLDAFVFLGDYLYEYGLRPQRVRDTEPPYEITSLDDYRTRYAFYRRDPDLQEAHRQHPWIAVWDDHEVANNSWTGGDSHGDSGAVYRARRDAGVQAWHEWLPCRTGALAGGEGAAADDGFAIYRRFDFGDLVRLTMLETRLVAREEPVNPNNPVGVDAPARQLMGATQQAWLQEQFDDATQAWMVLGQQVMMGPLTDGLSPINYDQWDGYPAARQAVYDAARSRPDMGFVVLTGDIHSSWGMELPGEAYDAESSAGAVGVEFVTPGIGSVFPGSLEQLVDVAKLANPHIRYGDVSHRGYTVVDFTAKRVRGTWFHVEDASLAESTVVASATYESKRTTPRLEESAQVDAPASDGPPLAPA